MASEHKISVGRHRRQCTICQHPECEEIQAAFIAWRSPAAIAEEYGLADRKTVYRHAHALELFPRRARNIRSALESILEKSGEVEVSASAVVAAVQAYAKINAGGAWIDRTEMVSMNDLFARMTAAELEAYASTGVLPAWFSAVLPATASHSHGDENDHEY